MNYRKAVLIGICALVALSPVIYMMATGDFPGARLFYGLQEDSDVVSLLLNIRQLIVR